MLEKEKGNYNLAGLWKSDTSIAEIINEFDVFVGEKKFKIPDKEYSEIFFPNLSFVNLPIIPPQVYKSLDEKYLFIYIYGKHRGKDIFDYQGFANSYIAKFILDIDKGYLTKIIIHGSYINSYGWTVCLFEHLKF